MPPRGASDGPGHRYREALGSRPLARRMNSSSGIPMFFRKSPFSGPPRAANGHVGARTPQVPPLLVMLPFATFVSDGVIVDALQAASMTVARFQELCTASREPRTA